MQRAMELANIGLAELDIDERFVAANPAYLSMLGMEAQDLIGQHWQSTVHPEDHGRTQEGYRAARNGGRGYVEVRARRKDSRVAHQSLTITALTDQGGALIGYSCLRHDISGYKRDQAALGLAVESAPNGLLMLDSAGRIQSVNAAVEKLFGYTRNELIGRSVETLLPPRYRSRHQEYRDAFSNSESTKAMAGRDLSGLRKDGVEIPLQVYLNRIATDSGELILCTITDIAERVRYQHQLEVAKQAAEAANRAKSDFLARMSHEIRTPMNLISGMNALLLESSLTDKQRQHVEISHRNVRRLLRLINGILDISKVEAGRLTLATVAFDLEEALNECMATMAAAIEQKGLQFEMSIAPNLWRFWIGDAERLHQILLNLIGNAVKFTAQGKIEVSAVPHRSEDGKDGVRFSVSDSGCGVPVAMRSLIFEAFQQADGTMNRSYEGTGLGLSIAKTLVQMMGGKIWVEDKPGGGAKFVFTAFFERSTERALSEQKSGATYRKDPGVEAGTRILLVEDNPENLILMCAYLETLSLSLTFASNGVEAVEKRKRGSYDLILMDIQMPIMDGYTATREIRAWEAKTAAPRVPIVAVTAHAINGAQSESLNAGCDGHLTKPVEQHEVVEAISKFAQRVVSKKPSLPDAILARRPEFISNRRQDVVRMREALAQREFNAIRVIGHNCKGTGVGYGYPEISRLGSSIEKAALSTDESAVADSIREFEEFVATAS